MNGPKVKEATYGPCFVLFILFCGKTRVDGSHVECIILFNLIRWLACPCILQYFNHVALSMGGDRDWGRRVTVFMKSAFDWYSLTVKPRPNRKRAFSWVKRHNYRREFIWAGLYLKGWKKVSSDGIPVYNIQCTADRNLRQ